MGTKKLSSSNTINNVFLEERCTLNKVLGIIGKRWVSEILLLIDQDVNRFSQLKECLVGISDNVLSNALNEAVKSGLIAKTAMPDQSVGVEYKITNRGKSLMVLMHQLRDWGKEEIPYEARMIPTYPKGI